MFKHRRYTSRYGQLWQEVHRNIAIAVTIAIDTAGATSTANSKQQRTNGMQRKGHDERWCTVHVRWRLPHMRVRPKQAQEKSWLQLVQERRRAPQRKVRDDI